MKRYLGTRYFVHYELSSLGVVCTMIITHKQATLTASVLKAINDRLGAPKGDAFILNISKVS